jgi:hypothetical protein
LVRVLRARIGKCISEYNLEAVRGEEKIWQDNRWDDRVILCGGGMVSDG